MYYRYLQIYLLLIPRWKLNCYYADFKKVDDLLSNQGIFRAYQPHLIKKKDIKECVKSDGGHLIMNDENLIPI